MLSEAKHLLVPALGRKRILRFAQNDILEKRAKETDFYGLAMRGIRIARWRVAAFALTGLLVAPLLAGAAAPKPTLEQIGNKVYCLCGCATLLNRCPHLPSECESRARMTTTILKDIQQGKASPAILDDLVRRYGVRVLASPPAAGFDLTVWVLPGIALIIGLAVVLTVVRRWRAKVAAAGAETLPVDPKTLAEVEEEMKSLRD